MKEQYEKPELEKVEGFQTVVAFNGVHLSGYEQPDPT